MNIFNHVTRCCLAIVSTLLPTPRLSPDASWNPLDLDDCDIAENGYWL